MRTFETVVAENNVRLSKLAQELQDQAKGTVVYGDSVNVTKYTPSRFSPQLIITSPPYAGAQKYIRASSLSLGWLDLCPENKLRALEATTIGREHYYKREYSSLTKTGIKSADRLLASIRRKNPLRAHIAATYLNEMRKTFAGCINLLKRDGYFVLVAGNNYICGRKFNTARYLKAYIEELGAVTVLELVDDIRSRGLMTKRNKTANMITRESVIVFQKP